MPFLQFLGGNMTNPYTFTTSSAENASPEEGQDFILIHTEDFQQMFQDIVNLTNMIDFLLERYHGYENVIVFQAMRHHEPALLYPDSFMMKDLEEQTDHIADRWSELDIVTLDE